MRHLFILNPLSFKNLKRRDAFIDRIKAACGGLEHEIYVSSSAADAQEKVAREAAAGDEICVYACGGDGCVQKVAEALYPYKNAVFSVVPVGTGNDFVRTFGGKARFDSLEHIRGGEIAEIDLIQAGGNICANVMNIGFDESVVRKVNELRRFPLMGKSIAYSIGVVIQLLKYPKEKLRITYPDGEVYDGDCLLHYVANCRYYGGGYHAASLAQPDDGLMDVLTVKPVSRLRFISLIGAYKKGTLLGTKKAEGITRFRKTDRLTISKDSPFHVCIDGEIMRVTNLDIRVLPKALRFKFPVGGFTPTAEPEKTPAMV